MHILQFFLLYSVLYEFAKVVVIIKNVFVDQKPLLPGSACLFSKLAIACIAVDLHVEVKIVSFLNLEQVLPHVGQAIS